MIGTSTEEYVFIRICIFCMRLITPLSIIYTFTTLLVHHPLRVPWAVEKWFILEAAFYLLIYLPRRAQLQAAATHPALPSREHRRKLFQQCHDNIPDPARYLRKWFRDAPEEEIKRDNVKEFFRWAFLNSGEQDAAFDEELEEYVGEMEGLLGRKLEPGRGRAKCIRMTLDEVDMRHRSLAWYLIVSLVDNLVSIYLLYQGLTYYRTAYSHFLRIIPSRPSLLALSSPSPAKATTYWYRPHTSKTRLPVLFIHGIGIGLYPYAQFVAGLKIQDSDEDGQVGVIAIEILAISSRVTVEALSKEDMCDEIHTILKAHGWDKFVLVSHSFGSVIATHLLRDQRIAPSIGPILFIDPITFLLHLPDVAYNFICRKPTTANEHQLSYFASTDMGVAHTLFRRFFWAEGLLWKEDIKDHNVTVFLGGRDLIVDTKTVAKYLSRPKDWAEETRGERDEAWRGDNLRVVWFDDLDHAQAFEGKATRWVLTDYVLRATRQQGKEEAIKDR